MVLEGVDLASHQGEYTYPTNPDFAIIKASGGHDYRNPLLGAQVANARAKNIVVGFYHYMLEPSYGTPSNPSGGDVAREAANFIEACRPYVQPGSTFWLDVEEYPATVGFTGDLDGWLVAFCEAVEAAFGCVCGIYCATWYLTATGLDRATGLRKYPFWMASWQAQVPPATYMAPWDRLTLHQYNADGIDKDRFYGTREQFLALGVPQPKVIEKKQEVPFQHAPGWLSPLVDTFDWSQGTPDAAGIVVARMVRVYNDESGKVYEGHWEASTGFTPFVEVQ